MTQSSNAKNRLALIFCSTRPARAGMPVAEWTREQVEKHGAFEVDFIDLQTVDLPIFDEPQHPVKGQYEHEHTKAWSSRIAAADAFVFVTPEYNHGMPSALLNALTFLSKEWNYKACGFVSYGGVSAGTRSVEMAKIVLTTLKVVPLFEGVSIPFFEKSIDDQKKFQGGAVQEKSAAAMVGELARWTDALKVLR